MTTKNSILADLGNLLIQAQIRAWERKKNNGDDTRNLAGPVSPPKKPQQKPQLQEA